MSLARRVLVTGIQGFTGCYVREELESSGWEVFGTGTRQVADDTHYYQVDLADESGLQAVIDEVQPDAVIHLAAISFVGHGDIDAFYRVNLMGTRHLLAVLAAGTKKPDCVLLVSSANVYGNTIGGVISERTPPNPANDYAVSKLAMEYMAHLWMDKLPIVIVRPFNYTGVGQEKSFLLPKIVSHFQRQADVIELGNLDVWRDFSDVRIVARVYRRLLEECPVGETVNVCSGHIYSLDEVLSMARMITGQAMQVKVNQAFVRKNEVKKLGGDPSKLYSLIGRMEMPPLEDTLRWMLAKR